jgi:outer membrane lipoprotein SlyB
MKTSQIIVASLITATALLSGCAHTDRAPVASTTYDAPAYASSYGVVDSIQVIPTSSGGSTLGTVAGGVVGGLLGHQVGGGRGNTAATVAGAVGGAAVGNEMSKNNQAGTAYQIGVRLDDGSYQTIQQDSVADLRVGNRVRIENGRAYRY